MDRLGGGRVKKKTELKVFAARIPFDFRRLLLLPIVPICVLNDFSIFYTLFAG